MVKLELIDFFQLARDGNPRFWDEYFCFCERIFAGSIELGACILEE
jgi:hypothetical protein